MGQEEVLVWLDLETTGLRPKDDAILEVGLALTDKDLNITDSMSWVCGLKYINVPLSDISAVVLDMHTKSGLWRACEQSTLAPVAVEMEACAWLKSRTKPGKNPACGSSVHFDRSFLTMQMPDLGKMFHYRNLDVSTFNVTAEKYCPEVFEGRPRGQSGHRVLDDIKDSIAQLAYYTNKWTWVKPKEVVLGSDIPQRKPS